MVFRCLKFWSGAIAFIFQIVSLTQSQGVLREVWRGIPGTALANLYADPRFPDQPDYIEILTNGFEAPTDVDDNYGQRLRAYLIPPQTGTYIFWIASDDEGVLFLSTDERPENKRQIASVPGWTPPRVWNWYAEQRSAPIRLEAGKLYYIEALMKEGAGGDNLAVRWRLPNGIIEEPIPAIRLKPFGMGPPNIIQHPQDVVVEENRTATFEVKLQNIGTIYYQWQRNGIDIPGATNQTYTIPMVKLSDNTARFRVRVWNDQGSAISQEAILTVVPDTTAPTIEQIVNVGKNTIVITFSEIVDPLSATNVDNYSIIPQVSILSIRLGEDNKSVWLSTSELSWQVEYTLIVQNVKDIASSPNVISPETTVKFIATDLTPVTLGQPSKPGQLLVIPNGYRIIAAGKDFDSTSDEGFFAYRERSGDFDMRVCVSRLDYTGPWAKATLMVRDSLDPSARYVAAVATPSIGGMFMLVRSTPGSMPQAIGSFPVNYPFTWIRLKRSGDNFIVYGSIDGMLWRQVGSINLSLPSKLFIGLGVCSQNTDAYTIAEFKSFEEVTDGRIGPIRWKREPIGPCTRRTSLAISEINYNPPLREDGKNVEFIEICNTQPFPVDLSGYSIKGDIHYIFPPATILRGGEFIIVAASPEDFKAVYGEIPVRVLGPYEGELPNRTGRIELWHPNGGVLIEVEYSAETPWPVAAAGTGHSLVLARPSYGTSDPRAWEASAFIGGSPGTWDPMYSDNYDYVVINEVVSNPGPNGIEFIELYNYSNQSVELGGIYITDTPRSLKYRIPNGIVIGPKEFLVLERSQLGFGLNMAGETVYMYDPDLKRVISAVSFKGLIAGLSWGRYPDGAGEISLLTSPTPGQPNASLYRSEVIINEIMFNPISGNDDDEFIELYNWSNNTIDLSGWRLSGGINFVIPSGTLIAPNGYLVIARNKQRILQNYSHLNSSEVLGNYSGRLSNKGEILVLEKPLDPSNLNRGYMPVDQLFYKDGGRWGKWADRGGSSLELVDPRADSRRPSSWACSDESNKSNWILIEHTGILDNGQGDANELHLLLLGAGECLVDDIEVIPQGGANVVPNGTFESGLTGWIIRGNHVESTLGEEGYLSSRSLLLRASGGGDNGVNCVKTKLSRTLSPGSIVTIRARARWLAGHTNLLLRLKGNWLEAVGNLTVPLDLGTPGRPNSRLAQNAGPAIWDVIHTPILPRATEPVVITAKVYDPDGVAQVFLRYRRDPSTQYINVVMNDDGIAGDEVAGDGIYTCIIPSQGAGVLAAFYITAIDQLGARSTFPDKAPTEEALIRWDDPIVFGSFGTYRMWFTQSTVQVWTQREKLSNHGLDGTFVYGQYRAIYNIKARYRGSPFIRPNYTGPTGNLCAYVLEVPPDEPLFGAEEFNLDWLEQPSRDPTLQCERTSFWIAEQLGLPYSHQSYVFLYVNGLRRGQIYSDSLHIPSGEYIPCWFPGQDEGELFKIDDWFEFNDAGYMEFNVDATLQNFTTTGGVKKQARYRWNWEKKANKGLDDNYSSLFELVDAANDSNTQTYVIGLEAVADINQWMRTFALRHLVGDWDGFGYNRGKNMFMYKPYGGKFKMLLWDLDFSLGGGSEGPTSYLFSVNDPTVARMYNTPTFRRAFLRAVYDAVYGPLLPERLHPVVDAVYEEFVKNRIQASAPTSIKSWVGQRRTYVIGVLNQENALVNFQITTNGGRDFQTTNQFIEITGTAPVNVETITVNDICYSLYWDSITQWRLRLPLKPGPNQLMFRGIDHYGNIVEGAQQSITITYVGQEADPKKFIMINEIMYHSHTPGAEFIELYNNSSAYAFDLSRWYIEGIDFVIPEGTIIPPGGYLLVVQDKKTFNSVYGLGLPVIGEFRKSLDITCGLIRLITPSGEVIDEVYYSNSPPWPKVADGLGASLQLIDPNIPNDRPYNWGAVDPTQAQQPEEVVLVPIEQTWRYSQTEAFYDKRWIMLDYDDKNWLEGKALLYVEDAPLPAPKNTPLSLGRITYYFRTKFENPYGSTGTEKFIIKTIVDDGLVLYLNGEELLRVGMPEGDINYDTLAARTVGDASLEVFEVPARLLRPGLNILAAEVHQVNPNSSDIVFGIELIVKIGNVKIATPGTPNSIALFIPQMPKLWLNELVVQNTGEYLDSFGESDPWLEIYNEDINPISLNGCYLSDDPGNLTKWAFPTNFTIPAKGYVIVWLDAQPYQTSATELHANFSPSRGGGSILLTYYVNGNLYVLDYFNYPLISVGRSYGRYPDGTAFSFIEMVKPSPGTSNFIELPSEPLLFINEWMASNGSTIRNPVDGSYSDWFEIYNASTASVDISGFMLTDNINDPSPFVIPPGYIIPPRGYLLVWADGHPEYNKQSPDLHVGFRLNKDGDTIVLLSPAGKVVDMISFGPQSTDISEGRYPDGAKNIEKLIPTPKAPNKRQHVIPPPQFIIQSLRFEEGDGFYIQWTATTGRRYRLESTEDLASGRWEILGEFDAKTNIIEVIDKRATAYPFRFYRAILLP